MAAAQSQALISHCLAQERQCNKGPSSLGLAHRIVGIVALSLYLAPHMSYVRKGQLDLKHMPYSAYRWVGRVLCVFCTCAVMYLRAMQGGVGSQPQQMVLLNGLLAVAAAASTAAHGRPDPVMQCVARCVLAVDGLK